MKHKMYYNLVLAMCKNKGVGFKGKLPWNLSADMAHFKDITTRIFHPMETKYLNTSDKFIHTAKNFFDEEFKINGRSIPENISSKKNIVVMGRNTWESLPKKFKPLPDRINVVLSSNEEFQKNNSVIENSFYPVKSIEAFFDLANDLKSKNLLNEIFVIGGSQIYSAFLENYPQQCKLIFHTHIEKEFESDTFFEIPKDFHHLSVSKTFVDKKDLEPANNTTFDFRILFNKNITKDSNLMNNFDQVINPYFLTKYPKHEEFQYLDIMRDIIENGYSKSDRTGVGTISKFGVRMSFDCSETFPLLTTKDTFWRGIVEELIWFIKGDTNAKHLQEKNIRIWDGNSSREYLDGIGLSHREVGDLGPVYGFQWRHFGAEYKTMHDEYQDKGVDQLKEVITTLKTNPNSRRIIMSAWNPVDLNKMALPPCHVLCQFYVENKKLNLQMYQRSGDMGLGIPFNIASYSLLLRMVSHITGYTPGNFVHIIGDAHVYNNHVEAIKKQLTRVPKPFPILKINRTVNDIENFKLDDFSLIHYSHWPKIKMEMAV